MNSLFEIYERVFEDSTNKYRWWYYHSLSRHSFGYNARDLFYEYVQYNSASDLIRKIYYAGGKDTFFARIDRELDERSRHMVSAFFLGHYLARNLAVFQNLCNDPDFPWLWFLCCLYHDAFFRNETSHKHAYLSPHYYFDSKNLLYSKTIIEYYRDYRLLNGCCDHGIYAAAALSYYYRKLFISNVRANIQNDYDYCEKNHLKINRETFQSVNKIAKVIASHNIFLAQNEKDKEKYKDACLEKLIPSANDNRKMPKRKGKYELLYLLLCLVDVIEPTKRDLDLRHIELDIEGNKNLRIVIHLNADLYANQHYVANIICAETWLNFINIENKNNNRYVEILIKTEV